MTKVRKRSRRVVLVEDNADELAMYIGPLREAGWDASGFFSAADALRAAPALQPDIVVTDLRMQGMDGIELTKRLRAEAPGRQVIVLSAFISGARAAYEAGCHTFLTKPCLPQTLLEILDKVWLDPDPDPPEGGGHRGP